MSLLEIIPSRERIQDSLLLSEEYQAAFEYNDFFIPKVLDDPALVDDFINFYLRLNRNRSNDTLHGVFFDITVHSDDPLIREISSRRIHQSMDIARALGVRGVIFHTNYIANFSNETYYNNWLQRNVSFFTALSDEYPKQQIYMENMFDLTPELFLSFGKAVEHCPNIHLCLDVAHAFLSNTAMDDWMKASAPYVRHLHLNDNDGVSDLHAPVGSVSIDWMLFDSVIRSCGITPSVLIETSSVEKQRSSLEYMKANHIFPFS